jgi:hypothetical protein
MEENNGIGIAAANAANPDAPEYHKGYKKENNAGCCGICGGTACTDNHLDEPSVPEIIRERYVREDFI